MTRNSYNLRAEPPNLTSVRVADLHVSQLSRENRILPTRAAEERAKANISESTARNVRLSALVPALQNQTSICCLGPRRTFTED